MTEPLDHHTNLIGAGDSLQSAASRMAEWIKSVDGDGVPYEVYMAALEAQTAVKKWTEARRVDK